VRVYDRALNDGEASSLATAALFAALAAPPEKREAADVAALFDWWLVNLDEPHMKLATEYDALAREQTDIQARGTVAHVMQEKPESPMAFVLNRGEYDQRRDQVAPATPAFLPPYPADLPRNRLGFAQWLVRPEHPLMARVTVNRFWQELFGTGLVKTSGDFGVTGELPSHPELLDWLAIEFIERGWSLKAMHKVMLESQAYQMASMDLPANLQIDPENRLFWRAPRVRLEAEIIRDNIMAVSGALDRTLGGPSIFPYIDPDLFEESSRRTWRGKPDDDPSTWRRSLYVFLKRSIRYPMFETFDQPNLVNPADRRNRTVIAPQALILMNNGMVLTQSKIFAERVKKEAGDDVTKQVDRAFQLALARQPDAFERKESIAFVRKAGLTDFCHALFNLNEFVYRY